jgi:hypothetical protein
MPCTVSEASGLADFEATTAALAAKKMKIILNVEVCPLYLVPISLSLVAQLKASDFICVAYTFNMDKKIIDLV